MKLHIRKTLRNTQKATKESLTKYIFKAKARKFILRIKCLTANKLKN